MLGGGGCLCWWLSCPGKDTCRWADESREEKREREREREEEAGQLDLAACKAYCSSIATLARSLIFLSLLFPLFSSPPPKKVWDSASMACANIKSVEIPAVCEASQIVSQGSLHRTHKGRPSGRRSQGVRIGSTGNRRAEKLVRAATDCPQVPADDETRDPFFQRSYTPPTCAFGSSGATLEKSSLDLTEHRTHQEAKTVRRKDAVLPPCVM